MGSSYKRPSVPHIELDESACCKYMARHLRLTKLIDSVTSRDESWRDRHRLQLQAPLPLPLIPLLSSCLQWMSIDPLGFWIRDEIRQFFETGEGSGSASNAACEHQQTVF